MADFIPSVTVDDVIDSLINVVNLFTEGTVGTRGQVNRVPMPNPAVVFTEILTVELSVPFQTYDSDTNNSVLHAASEIHVQIDFYGPKAGDWAKSAQTALRSQWGFDQFPNPTIKPLYCQEARQMPLTTGEQQYETRWTLQAFMQYNPVITLPQDSANVLAVDKFIAADVFY